jgi:F420H(2)-dependent quinone reductase
MARNQWLITPFTRAHAALLRLARGRWRRSLLFAGGQPVLSLSTVGRSSGRTRSTAVAYQRVGNSFVVNSGNLGRDQHPNWALNLEANPEAEIEVDGVRIPVRARRAEGEEAESYWRAFYRQFWMTETFRNIAGREIPLYVLEQR